MLSVNTGPATRIAGQVNAYHVTVTILGAQSFPEPNLFKPVIIHNTLRLLQLLLDTADSFTVN